jgi:sn-glycerol 3-phosphate transport system substrate-binding protein
MKKQFVWIVCLFLLVLPAGPLMAGGAKEDSGPADLKLYYPVAVSGPLANIIGTLCKEFNASHPDIVVEPIYAGSYEQTLQRVLTGQGSGNPGDLALLNKPGLWTAVDEDAVIPISDLVAAEGGSSFANQYWKSFWEDNIVNGELYGVPFQKSTPLLYYNKDMFREAGLDPEKPPVTWAELKECARKLAVKRGGNTERWGVEFPIEVPWYFQNLGLQNNAVWQNKGGSEVYFNSPEWVEVFEFVKSFVDEGLAPAKRSSGEASADFAAGATAIIYNSTGSLSFQRDSAKFNWGTGILPYNKTKAVTTGGASIFILKGATGKKKTAAWEFIKWMTTAERAAQWCIDTGYLAVRSDSFEVPVLKEYLKSFPQLQTTLTQLQYASPQPVTHRGTQVDKLFVEAIEGSMSGQVSIRDALINVQTEAGKILSIYK